MSYLEPTSKKLAKMISAEVNYFALESVATEKLEAETQLGVNLERGDDLFLLYLRGESYLPPSD
jgi:hypothetical protein